MARSQNYRVHEAHEEVFARSASSPSSIRGREIPRQAGFADGPARFLVVDRFKSA